MGTLASFFPSSHLIRTLVGGAQRQLARSHATGQEQDVRYRGLAKNTAQLHTLFALSNLWMARRTLLQEMRG
jgi:IS5 family transposase